MHVLATDPREPGGGHLDSTSLGPAGRGRCTIPREPGQYVDVHEPPVWSPDRRHLYLLASAPAHCGRRSYSVDDTAVLRLDVAEDGQLGEITNLTPIPPDWDHPRRMAISDLKLSPDGKVLVVVATSPHSVRSQDLFLASARMDEVYWEQLGMNPDATLLDSTVRLTTLARSGASLRGAFPLR